ncbi:transposase [Nocardioides sp.]|uniref:IS110 family transposase n=1 Tax=Nocardioides sp. TaxID=35761 RepID=UPI003782D76A
MVVQAARVTSSTVVVAVDVGKIEFAFSATDVTRTSLLRPRTGCPMTGSSLAQVVADIVEVLPVDAVVKVGIEAAGHYHRPLLNAAWPIGWEVLELNPAHVTEQRRVLGKRTVKTDVRDRLAGHDRVAAGRSRAAGPGPLAGAG